MKAIADFFALRSFQAVFDLTSLKTEDFNGTHKLSFSYNVRISYWSMIAVLRLALFRNIAKGTTDPGVDCFDH